MREIRGKYAETYSSATYDALIPASIPISALKEVGISIYFFIRFLFLITTHGYVGEKESLTYTM
jgi:hypothetical protein